MSRPRRIGVITPSSNTVVEPVTIAMTAGLYPRLTTHYSRVEVTTISLESESLAHFDLERMLQAALLLADAGMDVIAWNGTSGGWRGLETDYALCEAITSRTGAQATTSTLALIEAFKTYDVRNYALAVPYLESSVARHGSERRRPSRHWSLSAVAHRLDFLSRYCQLAGSQLGIHLCPRFRLEP